MDQQQNGAGAVELDPLALVVLHAVLDGPSGVVQPAFYRPLAGLHGRRDVLDAHLVVVIEQHAHALLRRQVVHQAENHAAGLLVVQGLLRNQLLVQILHAVQHGVSLLVLGNLPLLMGAGEQMPASVGGDAVHPPPEGGGLLQLVQAGNHDNQHVLSGILSILFMFQNLLAVVVNLVLGCQNQRLLGFRIALPAPPDQIQQLRLLQFQASSLPCLLKLPAAGHVPPRPSGNSAGEIEKR